MHTYVRTIAKVASRYAPSRALSFDTAHIFKALQLIKDNGHASRVLLCGELGLGEGSVKTLVKHLKMHSLVETARAGTKLTAKGRAVVSELLQSIPAETKMTKCSIALGRFNYAVLLKEFGFAIRSGIEQRDAAIKMGAIGATTLLFRDGKFVMPGRGHDCLRGEPSIRKMLVEKLKPADDDAIIIGSADDARTAELASKSAALFTIMDHDKHL